MTRTPANRAFGGDSEPPHGSSGRRTARWYLAWFRVGDAGALQVLRFTIVALLILIPLNVYYYELDRDTGFSPRVILFALPTVVSQLYHGNNHDYTAYAEVYRIASHYRYSVYKKPFSIPLDTLIVKLRNADVRHPEQLAFWGYDDRGLADFISASFLLFGPKYTSIIILYILVVILSATIFFTHYFEKKDGLFIVILALLAYNTAIVGFLFHQTPVNIVHERAFDLLSVVAIVHIGYFVLTSKSICFKDIFLILLQSFVFVFVYHARSSNAWQIGVLLLLSAGVVCVLVGRHILGRRVFGESTKSATGHEGRGFLGSMLAPTVPCLILIGTVVLLGAYTRMTYHPQYFAEQGSRTVWHNALMGLWASAKGREIGLGINDGAVRRAVRQNEADRLGVNVEEVDWGVPFGSAYEAAARRLYEQIVREAPWEILKAYLFTKPMDSLRYIWQVSSWGSGGKTSLKINISGEMLPLADESVVAKAREMGFYYNPFPLWIILVLAMAVFFARPTLSSCLKTISLATLLFGLGLVPSAIFYNQGLRQLTHVLAAISLLSYALVVTGAMLLIAGMVRFIESRPGRHAISPPTE